MKNVLLLTDFSKDAWNAIFMAVKLYADMECKFYVLHTYEPKQENITGFKSSTRAGVVYQSLSEASVGQLGEIMEYLEKNHKNPKHSFEKLSIAGGLVETIKDLLPRYDLDTIFMGTKGSTGAKEIFMGSNAVKVIKHIKNCAIVVVPESYDFQRLGSLVFPTEYAHFFPKNVLKPLLKLIKLWNSEVKIFHVAQTFSLLDIQKANKEILKKRFEGHTTSFHRVIIKTTVAEAIRQFAEEEKADLIVLTNYSHDFFDGLTQEPVVKKVTFRTEIPLMVLPDFEG
ncbi:universal stress protein [Flagellimonas sp.]|uniref:universal stress protein n=1 Tax=Flagellimonas sp. TaxID=2058762 RepID=UPI003BAC38A0